MSLDRVSCMHLQIFNAIILDDDNLYVNESLADDDILTKLTRMESGASITIFISLGSILDERMSCEVFESMETITLRAQADIAAIWCTAIDDSSCRVVEKIASIWLCIL